MILLRSNKSTKPNLSRSVDFPDGFSQGGSVFDNNTDPLGFGDGMRELNGNRPATSSIPMSPISSSHVNRYYLFILLFSFYDLICMYNKTEYVTFLTQLVVTWVVLMAIVKGI